VAGVSKHVARGGRFPAATCSTTRNSIGHASTEIPPRTGSRKRAAAQSAMPGAACCPAQSTLRRAAAERVRRVLHPVVLRPVL